MATWDSLSGNWDSFADRADDDVLLLAFAFLPAAHVLTLAAASTSAAVRLAGESAGSGSLEGFADGRPTVAQRLAVAQLNGPTSMAKAAVAAAAVAQPMCSGATDSDCTAREASSPSAPSKRARRTVGGPLVALRALASAAPTSEALRLGTALVAKSHDGGVAAATITARDTEAFLDAFFRSEMQRRNGLVAASRERGDPYLARKSSSRSAMAARAALVVAADAALTTLLSSAEAGASLALLTAEVIMASECELDRVIDEGLVGAAASAALYEAMARRRSAAEFLRNRLDSVNSPCDHRYSGMPEVLAAKNKLDDAVLCWDQTVSDYTKEGYVLGCPRLTAGIRQSVVPYSHWWLHAGRMQARGQGWIVLR